MGVVGGGGGAGCAVSGQDLAGKAAVEQDLVRGGGGGCFGEGGGRQGRVAREYNRLGGKLGRRAISVGHLCITPTLTL